MRDVEIMEMIPIIFVGLFILVTMLYYMAGGFDTKYTEADVSRSTRECNAFYTTNPVRAMKYCSVVYSVKYGVFILVPNEMKEYVR